jgi:hypothetical protein
LVDQNIAGKIADREIKILRKNVLTVISNDSTFGAWRNRRVLAGGDGYKVAIAVGLLAVYKVAIMGYINIATSEW